MMFTQCAYMDYRWFCHCSIAVHYVWLHGLLTF